MQKAGISRRVSFRVPALLIVFALVSFGVEASAQSLLIHQIYLDEGLSFVELSNPGSEDVSLEDHYLSTSADYPQVASSDGVEVSAGAFIAGFPEGSVAPPGRFVLQLSGTGQDFEERFGVSPDATLVSNGSEADPKMNFVSGQNDEVIIKREGGLMVLFVWDGASDLVADVDILAWGEVQKLVDKTDVSVDGVDEDAQETSYLPDTPAESQRVAAALEEGQALRRVGGEVDETTEGGNGVEGHDETSEDLASAFAVEEPLLGQDPGGEALLVAGVVAVSPGSSLSLAGAAIRVEEEGTSQQLDDTGAFELEVSGPGDYTLVVEGEGVAPNSTAVTVLDEDLLDVEIVVGVAFSLGGVVSSSADMSALGGVSVTIAGLGLSVETDESGAYLFEAVASGIHDVTFDRDGFASLTRTVEMSAEDLTLDVSLSQEVAYALTVRVTTPEGPAAGAAVTASSGAESLTVSADGQGVATLTNLPADRYTVAISHDGHAGLVVETISLTRDSELVVALVPVTRQPSVTQEGCSVLGSLPNPRGGAAPLLWLAAAALVWRRRSRTKS